MKRIAAIAALVLGVAAASTGAVSLHQVDDADDPIAELRRLVEIAGAQRERFRRAP